MIGMYEIFGQLSVVLDKILNVTDLDLLDTYYGNACTFLDRLYKSRINIILPFTEDIEENE